MKMWIIICSFIGIYVRSALSVSCMGCVDLDELSFNKTIRRFPYALVKFDIAFPYGEKHTAFGNFAQSVHRTTDELLVATVGIKDYGEMENKQLGLRFDFTEKNLPGIVLFMHGEESKTVNFPSHFEITEAHLKQFINENTPLYIGCDGCLKQFNLLIKDFAKLPAEKQLKQLQRLQEELAKASDNQNAQFYVSFARKIHEQGYQFLEQETKRLGRLRAGRVTSEKKDEIKRKLNILALFRVSSLDAKVRNYEEL